MEYGVWIPVQAIRFNKDGTISLKLERLQNPWRVMVKDGKRWVDSGEGPWDKKQDAIDFARAEVGVPYKVVKR